jgi:uroporphyrinogen-III synthase
MRPVVVLRPEPGASETIERAREQGLEAISIPLFEIEQVEWEAPDPTAFDALLLTSANAIRHSGGRLKALRALPVHAVGAATAKAASDAGFTIASSGSAGVDELLDGLDPGIRLLHLSGEDRRTPVNARQAIEAIPVYRSRAIDPPPALDRATSSVVLVHSPRAGERFAGIIDRAGVSRRSVSIAAISSAVSEAVGSGWEMVVIADGPSDEALLALAARLCNKPLPE